MYKILIVDDDFELASMMYQVFIKDYLVEIAHDGVTAIEIAQKMNPDIILLDVNMPMMDGFEVCRTLRTNSKFQKTKIVFLSVNSETPTILNGYESGADDFIVKPVNIDQLKAKVLSIKRQLELVTPVPDKVQEAFSYIDKSAYIKSDGNYVQFYSYRNKVPIGDVRLSLRGIYGWISNRFLHVNRSNLVAIEAFRSVGKGNIIEFKQKLQVSVKIKASEAFLRSLKNGIITPN